MSAENDVIRDVTLADLRGQAEALAARVRAVGFAPDVLVYLEEGARVPAVWIARQTDWPLLPLRIQRPDVQWKRWMRPMLSRLPAALTGWLRRREAARTFVVRGPRTLAPGTQRVDLAGRRVLIFDDAADSGSTLLAARAWVAGCGARPEETRTAVLTVTTPLGREVADFALGEGMCRFPWSSDSPEVRAHAALHAELRGEVAGRTWRP